MLTFHGQSMPSLGVCGFQMNSYFHRVRWLRLALLLSLIPQAKSSDAPGIGPEVFADARNPPPYRMLNPTEYQRFTLGHSVFETRWLAAGTPGSGERVGLGPMFNAASCNECHKEGQRGQGPLRDGPVPVPLSIQLESRSSDVAEQSAGDPIYGRVFNTLAIKGVQPEGAVIVHYREIVGYYYPFGGRWSMRQPRYQLIGMQRGPLAPKTIIKPRVAPALFGVGLLVAIPEAAISNGRWPQMDSRIMGTIAWHSRRGARMLGRLGWQGDTVSIRDQTVNAFAHEMGLTTVDSPLDDCTAAESDCTALAHGGSQEVSEELLDAVVRFVDSLAVPKSPVRADAHSLGSELFVNIGCAACHRPQLPVDLPSSNGARVPGVIAPFTDLRLHDLGKEMADENASGEKVLSLWRTAPLWGLGYRLELEEHPTFLHDGRARSTEEAVLWHFGEAARAKRRFMVLGPREREALLQWLTTL